MKNPKKILIQKCRLNRQNLHKCRKKIEMSTDKTIFFGYTTCSYAGVQLKLPNETILLLFAGMAYGGSFVEKYCLSSFLCVIVFVTGIF